MVGEDFEAVEEFFDEGSSFEIGGGLPETVEVEGVEQFDHFFEPGNRVSIPPLGGASLAGNEYEVKPEGSIIDKLERKDAEASGRRTPDELAASLTDVLRYTVVLRQQHVHRGRRSRHRFSRSGWTLAQRLEQLLSPATVPGTEHEFHDLERLSVRGAVPHPRVVLRRPGDPPSVRTLSAA